MASKTTYVNVKLSQGELRGKVENDRKGGNYCSFYAIPFAKPPLEELRFKLPQPAEPWTGVRDALVDNPGCYARHSIRMNEFVGQEDCLYLNIFTKNLPDEKTQSLKPVMVYVHGGGYVIGSNHTELYSPAHLMTEDVVIVSINYRLGILGFLSFNDQSIKIPGNAGMHDMILALKWVQSNIVKFNGDPENVTICGESAGGSSVHLLMLSPLAKGLFHKVIAMSGCALNTWAVGDCGYASKLLASNVFSNASMTEKEIYEKIKSLPVEELVQMQDKLGELLDISKSSIFAPVIERNVGSEPAFLTEKPTNILRNGNYNKVPLMIGFTSKEGIFLEFYLKLILGKLVALTDFEKQIPYLLSSSIPAGSKLSKEVAAKIKKFYYGDKEPTLENMEIFYDLDSDTMFCVDILRTIKQHIRTMSQPLYMYVFSMDTEMNIYKKLGSSKIKGASHADDLGYLFKTYLTSEVTPGSIEDKCIDVMVKFYTNFMRTSNPNSAKPDRLINVKWNPCTNPDDIEYMNLGNELSMSKNPKNEMFKFWEEIYAIEPEKIHH